MPHALPLVLAIGLSSGAAGRIGIFKLNVGEEALATSAVDALATVVGELRVGEVLTLGELSAMLDAQRVKDVLGCDDVTCLAELGGAAGVERIITGSIVIEGGALNVSLQLANISEAKVENRVTLRWPGRRDELQTVLGAAAELLLLPQAQRPPGVLVLRDPSSGLKVIIDGQAHDPGHIELPAGVYAVELRARGRRSETRPAVVRSGRVTHLDGHLVVDAERSRSGFGATVGGNFPLNKQFHSMRPGLSVSGCYSWDLPYIALQPRLALTFSPQSNTEAMYLDLAGDLGAALVLLDAAISPFLGIGIGARYLYIREKERTDTVGTVIVSSHKVIPTASHFGLAGYARLGLLLFRDAPVQGVALVDLTMANFDNDDRPIGLVGSLGVQF